MKYMVLALSLLASAPAFAEAPAIVTSSVQTADLDLSSQAGQRALDRRISIAIKEVCGTASPADLAGQNDVRRCFTNTLASLAGERDQRIARASGEPIEVAAR